MWRAKILSLEDMKIKEQHCLLKGYRPEPRAAWLNIQLISTTINLLTLVTDNMIYMYSKWQIDKHFNLSSYPDRSTSYEKLRLANTTLNCCISLIRLCCNLVTATVPNINKKIIRLISTLSETGRALNISTHKRSTKRERRASDYIIRIIIIQADDHCISIFAPNLTNTCRPQEWIW